MEGVFILMLHEEHISYVIMPREEKSKDAVVPGNGTITDMEILL